MFLAIPSKNPIIYVYIKYINKKVFKSIINYEQNIFYY